MVNFPMFKGFIGSTKLHGIPRVGEGSKPWIAFWAVLFGICVGMAIYDLQNLVNTYQSEQTAIKMSLVPLAPDYNWTTPTLCMEIAVDYFDDTKLAGATHMFSNPDFNAANEIPDIVHGFLKAFFTVVGTDNYTEIPYLEAIINPNLLYFPYMVLGYLIQLEENLMHQNQSNNYQFTLANNDLLANQHLQLFYDMYIQRNVSMSTITQLVGMWYCLQQLYLDPTVNPDGRSNPLPQIYGHMENYRYFGDPDYINLPMCKANMITHLGFGMVCSKLFETPNVPIVPDYNQFIIYNTLVPEAKKSAFADQPAGGPGNIPAVMLPNLLFHLDLQGRNVVPSDDRTNVYSWSPLDDVVLDITVSNEFQFLSTQRQSCSSSPVSQSDCKWQKQVESVYQQCGCWPGLADIQNPKRGLNCSVNPINPLLNSIYDITWQKFCPNAVAPDLSECIMDCHLYNFSFTRHLANRFQAAQRTWGRVGVNQAYGSLEFRFGFDSHTFITESPTTDWANFLGTWGGSIGTWLGASVLAFIHIPVYIIRQYGSRLFKCKAKPSASG